MPQQIVKRDGRVESWSVDRIAQAILPVIGKTSRASVTDTGGSLLVVEIKFGLEGA